MFYKIYYIGDKKLCQPLLSHVNMKKVYSPILRLHGGRKPKLVASWVSETKNYQLRKNGLSGEVITLKIVNLLLGRKQIPGAY